jgi:hypothetical protein
LEYRRQLVWLVLRRCLLFKPYRLQMLQAPYIFFNHPGTPMRRSYVVPMRWMVIYGYEVPGGALNLSSTELPRPWSPWESSPSRKNPHGRTGNRTRDLMISSQKLRPLDREAGLSCCSRPVVRGSPVLILIIDIKITIILICRTRYQLRSSTLPFHSRESTWMFSAAVAYRGVGVWGFQTPPPPRNSEVLTKLSRIPGFMENTSTSVTT